MLVTSIPPHLIILAILLLLYHHVDLRSYCVASSHDPLQLAQFAAACKEIYEWLLLAFAALQEMLAMAPSSYTFMVMAWLRMHN